MPESAGPVIDDRRSGSLETPSGTPWRLVSDQVMGGVSRGDLRPDHHDGRGCLRLTGTVSTDNNGGFLQMALDLDGDGPLDAGAHTGLELEVAGNGEAYNVHLRTRGLWLPWQAYRATFQATPEWRTLRLPFADFTPYRTDRPLRPEELARIGIVAIGRDFEADLCLGALRLYGEQERPRP